MFNGTVASPVSVGLPGADVLAARASCDPSRDDAVDVDALRREVEQMRAVQRELMHLLGTTRPDRILHDVRNILQERIFLEAAVKRAES